MSTSPAVQTPQAALAQRLSRDTILYAAASVGVFVFGIVNVAVLTRMLSLEEFGELALYMVGAAALTVIYNAGSLQGTVITAFGAGEDGGEERRSGAPRASPGTTLTSAFVLTLAIATAGTVIVWLLRAPLAELASGDPQATDRVMLAATTGAFGSLFRLALNVPRFERRAWTFVALNTCRAALTVSLSVTFVAMGGGVRGALAGVALGTLVATLGSIVAARRAYALPVSSRAAVAVVREGKLFVALVLSVWVVYNVDLYLVSAFNPDEVPLYRVASRLGAGVSYFVSGFLMAWMPLFHSATHVAAVKKHGPTEISALTLTYFLFASLWLVVGLAVLADLLIRVAPEDYSDAASLIPLIGLGLVIHGFYVVSYRIASMPRKRPIYAALAVAAAAMFIGLSLVFIPRWGGHGAALAQILSFACASTALHWIFRKRGVDLPLAVRRNGKLIAIAVACIGISQVAGPGLGHWSIVLDGALLAAMPLIVVAVGVLPRSHVTAAVRMVAGLSPLLRRKSRFALGERIRELDAKQATILRGLVRDRRPPSEVAKDLGVEEETVLAAAVDALRRLEDSANEDGPQDLDLGRYLFSTRSVAEQNRLARALWAQGVDPVAASRLEATAARVRRLPRRAFST